jgi:two-component system chemotaxis response regulator CheB
LDLRKFSLTLEERLQRQGQAGPSGIENLIVIGASAGGLRALVEILKDFSPSMPAAIVILLHMRLGANINLQTYFGRSSRLPIIEVENEEPLQQECVFLPQPGRSAIFTHGMITLEPDVSDWPVSTINRLFTSAAQSYGNRVIGVILTGLLRDGTEGLRAVHEADGLTMVQDPRQAEYPKMPTNAMEKLPVTFCLNLEEIGPALELLVRRTVRFETGLEVAIRTLRDRATLLVRLAEQSWRNPGTRTFLGNELDSLKRDIHSIEGLLQTSVLGDK